MAKFKQKDRAALPKQKSIVYISTFQKLFFEPDSDQIDSPEGPKIVSKGPKSAKKTPILAELKTKRWGCTFTQSIMQVQSFLKSAFFNPVFSNISQFAFTFFF